jgi:hypothetical protein
MIHLLTSTLKKITLYVKLNWFYTLRILEKFMPPGAKEYFWGNCAAQGVIKKNLTARKVSGLRYFHAPFPFSLPSSFYPYRC